MPSGYTVNSTDLDDIFAPLGSLGGTPVNAVGFNVGASDLYLRYEPISASDQQIPYNTNYISNNGSYTNTDLKYIFVDKSWTRTPTPTLSLSATQTPTPSSTPPVTPSQSYH